MPWWRNRISCMRQRPPPAECPACGEDVPPNAKACPGCGACYRSGWSDDLGDEEAEFDYEEFVAREFEGREPKRKNNALWWITGVILLLSLAWLCWLALR